LGRQIDRRVEPVVELLGFLCQDGLGNEPPTTDLRKRRPHGILVSDDLHLVGPHPTPMRLAVGTDRHADPTLADFQHRQLLARG